MTDVQPKTTTSQIVTGVGVILIIIMLAFAAWPEPEAPPPPDVWGRYQIVAAPSGIILRIDTYDGTTFRLVNKPENGDYEWHRLNNGTY